MLDCISVSIRVEPGGGTTYALTSLAVSNCARLIALLTVSSLGRVGWDFPARWRHLCTTLYGDGRPAGVIRVSQRLSQSSHLQHMSCSFRSFVPLFDHPKYLIFSAGEPPGPAIVLVADPAELPEDNREKHRHRALPHHAHGHRRECRESGIFTHPVSSRKP